MDTEAQQVTHWSSLSLELESDIDSVHSFDQPDAHCFICRRVFLLETETSEFFEAVFICRDCKLVVFDDLNEDVTARDSSQRRQQRRVSSESSESIEDLSSQQFMELVDLARHNHETRHLASYNTYQSRSRWHQTLSDNGSESLDHVDSLFAEYGSNISFNGNGGESDVSLDGHGFLERDIFIRRDDESRISDSDIDLMLAGEWEEADAEEEANGFVSQERQMHFYASSSSTRSNRRDSRSDRWLFWRTQESGSMRYPDLLGDMEEADPPQYFGNSGDYLDTRGFEALLEQLAGTDGSRRGAPPAAASVVRSLPCVIISKVHEKNGSLICAVCKDPMPIGTEASQLPCLHFYHHSCILPWLRTRNSCPVCRYELATDDPDYEGKRNTGNRRELNEIQQANVFEENSSTLSGDGEIDTLHRFSQEREVQGNAVVAEPVEDGSNGWWRRGWMYRAAAPIVSIVGVILVLWLGTPLAERSFHRSTPEQDSDRLPRSLGSNLTQERRVHRNRRWWPFF